MLLKRKKKDEERRGKKPTKKFTVNLNNNKSFSINEKDKQPKCIDIFDQKATEIHNKNVNVVVINNILTEPCKTNKQELTNLTKKLKTEIKTNPTRNIQEKLLITSSINGNSINNTTKHVNANNIKLFQTTYKANSRNDNKSINTSYQKPKLDASFNKKISSAVKSPTPLQISTTPVTLTSKKINLNLQRPESINPKSPNNQSYYLKYRKLNDSLIKNKFEKKLNLNNSNVKKILDGQSYNIENSSLICANKEFLNFSGATSTKHSKQSTNANASKTIINLKYKSNSTNKKNCKNFFI